MTKQEPSQSPSDSHASVAAALVTQQAAALDVIRSHVWHSARVRMLVMSTVMALIELFFKVQLRSVLWSLLGLQALGVIVSHLSVWLCNTVFVEADSALAKAVSATVNDPKD